MTKLKLRPIFEDKSVKVTVELTAQMLTDLSAHKTIIS